MTYFNTPTARQIKTLRPYIQINKAILIHILTFKRHTFVFEFLINVMSEKQAIFISTMTIYYLQVE